ncbi:MAG: ABC transporter ATP-binding protein [Candidatus Thalassarchaeaceae archaeon]|nr:ABC transporter ATP-binding protein [Candidatus Thalassarchaeaceae archaeon]MEE2630040.1 ABC transporter ATP-binding protein [Candidatus Thermoplasmatota archaeon]
MEGGGTEILRANSLYHIYESNAEEGNVVALRGLSVSILEGEAVAVVGPSGSGKSTLLKCLGGLMKPSAGSVELGGTRMTRLTGPELVKLRQETVSFIFQDSNLLPHLNALDNVAQPLIHQGVLAGPARRRAQDLLDRLGMGDRSFGMPEELSGGEQQRVAISRALITNPKLILADEPTGALDPITSREVLDLFDNLHKESDVAFLLVTHNREVASFCERSLELREGRFIAQHGGDVDIGDLSDSRELIVDDSGTVTLPPDVLLQLGGPGRFEVPELKRDVLHLERVEEDKISIGVSGKMELSPSCPACFHQYGNSDEQLCPECGSSRPMVQA